MTLHERQVYKEALDLWGRPSQVLMTIEEAGELLQALSKYERAPSRETKLQVLEEIVDLDIMLGQLRLVYDSSPEELYDLMKSKKLDRLKTLINNQKREEVNK